MTSSITPFVTRTDRLHGLDALRGLALMLGVLVHASMSFIPGAQYFWLVADSQPNAWLGLGFHVPHMFRMILFFLLAGFFGRMALHRLGLKSFIHDRAKRIGLPLLAGWPISLVAITAVLVLGTLMINGGVLPPESPPGPTFAPDDFPLTHLWFLYELLIAYGVMLLLRALFNSIDRRGQLRSTTDIVMRFACGRVAPLLLAIPLCAALYAQPQWYGWFGIPTPDSALYPNLAAAAGFGSAFAFGWLLQRQNGLLERINRLCWSNLSLALITTVASLWIYGLSPGFGPSVPGSDKLLQAALYSVASWGWTFALIGLTLRYFADFNPVRRYLADASYWIYLAHLPLVVALQFAVAPLTWPAPLKLGIILVLSMAMLVLSYHWLVRFSFIGAILNGRKRVRRIRAEPTPPLSVPARAGATSRVRAE